MIHAEDAVAGVLARIINIYDPNLFVHCERVYRLIGVACDVMGLDDEECRIISRLARVHDIGKVGVPRVIIYKPSRLTHDEFSIMKKHAEHGEYIMRGMGISEYEAAIMRHHHERWDGGGYPDGLRAGDIPLGARVMAIFDAYCAMTNHRPYAGRVDHPNAVTEIVRCAGAQFDPALVERFVRATDIPHPLWYLSGVADSG